MATTIPNKFNIFRFTENDNNFGYEKITILVDNMPLSKERLTRYDYNLTIMKSPKPATDNRFKKSIKSYLCILCYSLTIICCCQMQNYIYWIISTENDHRHHHKFIKYEKRLRKEGNMLG
jgi:hypothetical protein